MEAPVEAPVPHVPLLHIFSFLDAASLLRAGQVSKYWNRMADNESLWRWPGRWAAPQELRWKQLFLAHGRRELRMARARPQDFSYREARGRLGILKPMAYLTGNDPTQSGQRSILCSASTRRMLFAWDVQEVGDSAGDIHTLTVPGLEHLSRVHAFDHTVNHLHCSPNGKWVFAGATLQLMMPKVFAAQFLLRPQAGEDSRQWASLPLAFCSQACWARQRASRVTMMIQQSSFRRTGFSTFDLAARTAADGAAVVEAHQVASFMLPNRMERPFQMGVQDGAAIVLQSGSHLLLFSIQGTLLQRFDHHQRHICHLWTDALHVVTTAMDDFLHLYVWEEGGLGPRLRSCCHLEQRRADPTPSCFPSYSVCDNASVVCVVTRNRETSVLVMYSLPP
ncbi:F-box/WD repeat-containing protein 12 [Pipistrellus kuhlii]|uniref:F-box/WD repeat-containing protein 12 n=1 Tax=Pipistrellus kuhlii TaxID=59472 RepID=UPI00174ED17A|nr:F-box/WD repeat-containing protein 12 [Pipistrellus kuhlii]